MHTRKMEIDALSITLEKGFDKLIELSGQVSEEERLAFAKDLLADRDSVRNLMNMPLAKTALTRVVCAKDGVKNVRILIEACGGNPHKLFQLYEGLQASDPFAEDAKTVAQAARFFRDASRALRK